MLTIFLSGIFALIGLALVSRKGGVSVTSSRKLRYQKARILGIISFAVSAFYFFVFGYLPETLDVIFMAGLPIIIVILAIYWSEETTQEDNASDEVSVSKLVNTIMWIVLLSLLGLAVFMFK